MKAALNLLKYFIVPSLLAGAAIIYLQTGGLTVLSTIVAALTLLLYPLIASLLIAGVRYLFTRKDFAFVLTPVFSACWLILVAVNILTSF